MDSLGWTFGRRRRRTRKSILPSSFAHKKGVAMAREEEEDRRKHQGIRHPGKRGRRSTFPDPVDPCTNGADSSRVGFADTFGARKEIRQ